MKRYVTNFTKGMFLFTFLIIQPLVCNAQQPILNWVRGVVGQGNIYSMFTKTDPNGSVYSVGIITNGSFDFDPGPGANNISAISNSDLFIEKLDFNGDFLWGGTIAGINGSVYPMSIATDNNNCLYMCGQFDGTIDFDPGINNYNVTNTGTNTQSAFLLKLDATGNLLWFRPFSSFDNYNRIIRAYIDVDPFNNVFVTGMFEGIVDFNPGLPVDTLSWGNGSNFIVKFTSNGDYNWGKQFGNTDNIVEMQGIADSQGNLILKGGFYGQADFDPGPAVYSLTSNLIFKNFISKVDSSGNLIWIDLFDFNELGTGLYLNFDIDSNDFIYKTGYFFDSIDFDPDTSEYKLFATCSNGGCSNSYFLKLSPQGEFVWVKQLGFGITDFISLTVSPDGHIFEAGTFTGTFDVDPGPAIHSLAAPLGVNYPFILKLDDSGSYNWAKVIGDGEPNFVLNSIYADLHNNVYSTGSGFTDSTDFDPDTSSSFLTGNGMFIQKWNHCPPVSETLFLESCFPILINNVSYNSSGFYTQFLCSTGGCDSILYLNLTIHSIDNSVLDSTFILFAMDTSATFQWVDCDNSFAIIPGETSQSFTPSCNGNYAVILSNGVCVDTSACFPVVSSAIIDKQPINDIIIYPNPTNGLFFVDFGTISYSGTLEIRNVLGGLIELIPVSEAQKIEINLKAPVGIYYVSAKSENRTKTFSLLKMIN